MSALVSRRVRIQWRGLRPIPGEFVLFISKTGRRIQQSDTKFYLEKAMPTGRRSLPPPKAWEASNITFWNRKGAGFLSLKLPADVWIPSVQLMGRHFEQTPWFRSTIPGGFGISVRMESLRYLQVLTLHKIYDL